jgi:integrase
MADCFDIGVLVAPGLPAARIAARKLAVASAQRSAVRAPPHRPGACEPLALPSRASRQALAARLLDGEQRKLEWRDVRSIRESDEPATSVAGRYGVSETLIRRIRRNEIWVTRRPREATRLPAVATLLLAGPRVSELCQLDESQVDLAARRIRIRRVKTDASERTVPMVPALHETLLAAKAKRETHGGPAFPTRNGTRQDPDNVRSRLLTSVCDRANDLVPARSHRPDAHDARLPAGARHGRRGRRDA